MSKKSEILPYERGQINLSNAPTPHVCICGRILFYFSCWVFVCFISLFWIGLGFGSFRLNFPWPKHEV